MGVISALCDNEKVESLPQKLYGLQRLMYLPSSLLQKKLEDPPVLDQWFSSVGPRQAVLTSPITGERVRNAVSQVTPRSTESETPGGGAQKSVF